MNELRLYNWMSGFSWLNYRAKIMVMAFIGTHIPLIALVAYFAFYSAESWRSFFTTLGVTLVATLIGTGVTLLVLNHLLRPVIMTAKTLRAYKQSRDRGSLPTQYTDEVGTLMADASETIAHLDDALDRLEYLDATTGLANRKRLVANLSRDMKAQEGIATCAIRFGNYNLLVETLDLQAAESAVAVLVARVKAALPSDIALYRVSSLNFAFLTTSASGGDISDEAGTRLTAILDRCGASIDLKGVTIEPRLQGGVAMFPNDASEADALIDHALAAAASPAHAGITFHSPQARRAAVERLQLEEQLRRAVTRDELVLHYQPVVDLAVGRVTGAEALVRWQHPELGLLSPDKFIGLAETSGLIDEIGLWVMRQACRQVKDWNISGLSGLKIAINLSFRQFLDPNLFAHVNEALDGSGVAANQLEIELTESVAMADHNYTRTVFGKLRDRGLSIAIDDFGTGYASMSYLRKLPFDKLKIDREFVTNVHMSRESQSICGALVTLANGFGLKVLAEGTESEDEVRYLASQGCNLYQGYYFSRPLPAAVLERDIAAISGSAMRMMMRRQTETAERLPLSA